MYRTFLLLLLVLAPVSPLFAQHWMSPDGVLRLAAPEAAQFDALPEPPAPFLALWVSKDEATRLGVMMREIPAGIELVQSAMEEGLAEEVKGTVTRLPTTTVSGREIWKMRAVGEAGEITQAIVRHQNKIYKVMAVCIGAEPDRDATERFINSISFQEDKASASTPGETSAKTDSPLGPQRVVAAPQPPALPPVAAARPPGDSIDTHELSKKIGSYSVIALVAAAALYFLFRPRKER